MTTSFVVVCLLGSSLICVGCLVCLSGTMKELRPIPSPDISRIPREAPALEPNTKQR